MLELWNWIQTVKILGGLIKKDKSAEKWNKNTSWCFSGETYDALRIAKAKNTSDEACELRLGWPSH